MSRQPWRRGRALASCAAGGVLMVAGALVRGGPSPWLVVLFPLTAMAVVLLRGRRDDGGGDAPPR